MIKWFRGQPITIRAALIAGMLALFGVILDNVVPRIWAEPPVVFRVEGQGSPNTTDTSLGMKPSETATLESSLATLPPSTPSPEPSITVAPQVSLDYTLVAYALGPGRVDLLRLHNAGSVPISVVSFGAIVVYQGQQVVVDCQEGFCIPGSSYPDPIVYASINISPEAVFFRGPDAPTPDPLLIYPHEVPPGAADYVSRIAIWLNIEGETLPEPVTVAPFLILSDGWYVIAPSVRAITLGPFQ